MRSHCSPEPGTREEASASKGGSWACSPHPVKLAPGGQQGRRARRLPAGLREAGSLHQREEDGRPLSGVILKRPSLWGPGTPSQDVKVKLSLALHTHRPRQHILPEGHPQTWLHSQTKHPHICPDVAHRA